MFLVRACCRRAKGGTCAAMVHHSSAAREQPVVRRIAPPQHVHILWHCHALCCAQLAPTCPRPSPLSERNFRVASEGALI